MGGPTSAAVAGQRAPSRTPRQLANVPTPAAHPPTHTDAQVWELERDAYPAIGGLQALGRLAGWWQARAAAQCVPTHPPARPAACLACADRLAADVSKGVLEDVRQVKQVMGRLTGRVQRIKTELEEILNDDADMQVGVGSKGEQETVCGHTPCLRGCRCTQTLPYRSPATPLPTPPLSRPSQDMYLARRAMLLGEEPPPERLGMTPIQSFTDTSQGGARPPSGLGLRKGHASDADVLLHLARWGCLAAPRAVLGAGGRHTAELRKASERQLLKDVPQQRSFARVPCCRPSPAGGAARPQASGGSSTAGLGGMRYAASESGLASSQNLSR